MKLLQVGNIQTESEKLKAMLCIDADRPNEVMVHWWGEEAPAGAALTKVSTTGDGMLNFSPFLLFKTNQNGGMILATPQEASERGFFDYRMRLSADGDGLLGEWTHSSGKKGIASFSALADTLSVQADKCDTWIEFKAWATRCREDHDVMIYRGHGNSSFRLQTTLTRAGRNRLERYCAETLQTFRSHAEALLGKRFNLNDGEDYSTIIGLAQHHGLPTPLLDWTESPYIAAFFAFSDAIEAAGTRADASHVRVYGATRAFLEVSSPSSVMLPWVKPYVCSLSIPPRDNPRLYAQQGRFMVTNYPDAEGLICALEARAQEKFLVAADIPIRCASQALEDLAFMGLTAGTMFPGLDGVCRMMRHAMIFKRPTAPRPGNPLVDEQNNQANLLNSN